MCQFVSQSSGQVIPFREKGSTRPRQWAWKIPVVGITEPDHRGDPNEVTKRLARIALGSGGSLTERMLKLRTPIGERVKR